MTVGDPRYERVVLITANTTIEDPDNWRFAIEVWRWLGEPEWHVVTDGRHPMQVGRDRSCVPNNRWAVCSQELKIKVVKEYMAPRWSPESSVLVFGYDPDDTERLGATTAGWAPWECRYPLIETTTFKWEVFDRWDERGIRHPRLYDLSPRPAHANCGGGCVRGGQAAWEAKLRNDPDGPFGYAWWEAQEEESRAFLGKDVAIMRHRGGRKVGQPLTLREFRERLELTPTLFDATDWGPCGCYPEGVPVAGP